MRGRGPEYSRKSPVRNSELIAARPASGTAHRRAGRRPRNAVDFDDRYRAFSGAELRSSALEAHPGPTRHGHRQMPWSCPSAWPATRRPPRACAKAGGYLVRGYYLLEVYLARTRSEYPPSMRAVRGTLKRDRRKRGTLARARFTEGCILNRPKAPSVKHWSTIS